jgi:hypothetical protein
MGTDNAAAQAAAQAPSRGISSRVFVSHSSLDAAAAQSIVHALESAGMQCWIAPRDIPAGSDYNAAIMAGINACRVMVLVYSRHAIGSDPVHRELERAVARRNVVVPVRLENVPPSPALEFMISTRQWVDAYPPPLEQHLKNVVTAITRATAPASEGTAQTTIIGHPSPRWLQRNRNRLAMTVLSVVLACIAIVGLNGKHSTREDALTIVNKPAEPTLVNKPAEPTVEDTVVRFGKNLTGQPLGKLSATELKLVKTLDERTELEFIEAPLSDVVEYLRTRHSVDLQIDNRALEEAGIATDVLVTRNLKDTPLRVALQHILYDLELTCIIYNEALVITTATHAAELEKGAS